jgi:hypothetical protein
VDAVLQGLQELVGASLRPDMLGAVYWIITYAAAAFLLISVFGFLYSLFFLAFPLMGWARQASVAHPSAEDLDSSYSSPSLSYHSSVLRSPSSRPISGA